MVQFEGPTAPPEQETEVQDAIEEFTRAANAAVTAFDQYARLRFEKRMEVISKLEALERAANDANDEKRRWPLAVALEIIRMHPEPEQ
jgi:hypothetical protein